MILHPIRLRPYRGAAEDAIGPDAQVCVLERISTISSWPYREEQLELFPYLVPLWRAAFRRRLEEAYVLHWSFAPSEPPPQKEWTGT